MADTVQETPTSMPVITLDDVVALGSVDEALGQFYDDAVAQAAVATGTSERAIREWFEDQLLNEHGFRTQTLDGPGPRGPEVLRELEDGHVIRPETRRGARWYELSHDRLVAPVRNRNSAWRAANLSALQIDSTAWSRQGRATELLAVGERLHAEQAWADEHPHALLPVDGEFLTASHDNERKLRVVARASRRVRIFAVAAGTLALLALIGTVVAYREVQTGHDLRSARDEARTQTILANRNADEARISAQQAADLRIKAEDNAEEAKRQQAAAEKNEDEARRQQGIAAAAEDDARRQQGIAEVNEDEATRQQGIAEENAAEAKRQADRARAAAAEAATQRDRAQAVSVALACEVENGKRIAAALQAANEEKQARSQQLSALLARARAANGDPALMAALVQDMAKTEDIQVGGSLSEDLCPNPPG